MLERHALAGVRILDLTRVLAGPFATQMLGDLGAEVWKIEALQGDDTRIWGEKSCDPELGSHYFAAGNRSKKGLAINLKDERGRDLVRRLALQADIVVENYKVGDLSRYGLGWEQLSRLKPSLVYASVTGYGQNGPRAASLGYDTVLQAMTGIMSVTGEPDRPPCKVGVAWIDVMSGLVAAVGLLAALRHRDATGEGQHLDLSLFDVGMMALVDSGQDYLQHGAVPVRQGSVHRNFAPSQPFRTADGWVITAIGNEDQYRRFCAMIGRPDLATHEDYATNELRLRHRERLAREIEPVLLSRDRGTWLRAASEAKVPLSPIHDIRDAFDDPQSRARRVVWEVPRAGGATHRLLANPLQHMSATPARARGAPPRLGEHTAQVLGEQLGLTPADVAALAADGVLASTPQARG